MSDNTEKNIPTVKDIGWDVLMHSLFNFLQEYSSIWLVQFDFPSEQVHQGFVGDLKNIFSFLIIFELKVEMVQQVEIRELFILVGRCHASKQSYRFSNTPKKTFQNNTKTNNFSL